MPAKPAKDAVPAALGYRMPAEWEPHAATWIAWPHNREDWPGKFHPIPWVYVEIVRNLARRERVEILVNDAGSERSARRALQAGNALSDAVRFHHWPTDRVWTRDFGPIFVRREGHSDKVGATKWAFNAWAKYSNWHADHAAGASIAKYLEIPCWRPAYGPKKVVLEGGSIDVNGRGTMLTTEECLLSEEQQRNPGMGRKELERVFADYLGVRHVIWLNRGIVGDDTHGHVDDLARFVTPDTVVAVAESDPADANYDPLQENLARLRSAKDQDGRPLTVVELPMPEPVFFLRRRLPASYANFYIANKVVLAPTFNDPNDRVALTILAGLFPDRDVVGIYCGDLVWGLGTIHCMTQQQPG